MELPLVALLQTGSLSQSGNLTLLDYYCLIVVKGAGDAMAMACSLLVSGVSKATRLHLLDAALSLANQIHFTCARLCG